jgi:hypothetical protein
MTVISSTLISIENDILKLNYSENTNHVSYCVADFWGNVVARGGIDELKDRKLEISKLRAGAYTFCLIDGDSLSTQRFQKN